MASQVPQGHLLSDQSRQLHTRDADRGNHSSQCSAAAGGISTEQRVEGAGTMEGEASTLHRPPTQSAFICAKWYLQKILKSGALIATIKLPRVSYYLKLQVKLESDSKIDLLFSCMHVCSYDYHSNSSIRKTDLLHFISCRLVVLSTNTVMFCRFQTIPEIHFLFDFCLKPLETSSLAIYISLWRLGACLLREQPSTISFRSSPHFY